MTAEKTVRKQRGKPLTKGVSGNPDGRPAGSRNETTIAVESLLNGEAEALTRKAIELAKGGDMAALRLCLERIAPPRKDRPVAFASPAIDSPAAATQVMGIIVGAVANGDLTPSEAAELSKLVESYARAVEVSDLDERLTRLEKMGRQ